MQRPRRGSSSARRPKRADGLLYVVAVAAVAGCFPFGGEECVEPPLPPPIDEALSPIARALRYLQSTQLKSDQQLAYAQDWRGNWPQCVTLDGSGIFVRDVSPFMGTFIHHALTLIVEENRFCLKLAPSDIDGARSMRRAAVEMMLRFEAGPDRPDAGTFGFWPELRPDRPIGHSLLSWVLAPVASGPFLHGSRVPVNIWIFPQHLQLPSDADDTAVAYAVLLDHQVLDGGGEVTRGFERFFADWRDLGQVPRRNHPDWLAPNSGAYLTWLNYGENPEDARDNDVDVGVNANILYALGRYGKLDTVGVGEAIGVINAAVQADLHPFEPFGFTLYYPDNLAVHYCVARAYREGGVAELAPAAEVLVSDLIELAQCDEAGRCHWDRGHPHLNTAFAVLALMEAGYRGELVDDGIAYLLAEQDADSGAWKPGVFFGARLDDGTLGFWVSAALTTAMALEALARYGLIAEGMW
ncbi:MAG: hypothetical protein JSU68_03095 [Phycisphaerales bacterium]|nr:MAG: hypothetical protein JSU68_03095 [Phycisphaerales bacterium]